MCFACEQHAWLLDLEHERTFIMFLKHLRSVLCHLEEHFFYSAPNKVGYQKLHKFLEFMEGIPSNLYAMTEGCENSLVIFDDLMSQCSNDQHMPDPLLVVRITVEYHFHSLLKTFFHHTYVQSV